MQKQVKTQRVEKLGREDFSLKRCVELSTLKKK